VAVAALLDQQMDHRAAQAVVAVLAAQQEQELNPLKVSRLPDTYNTVNLANQARAAQVVVEQEQPAAKLRNPRDILVAIQDEVVTV
jgi:hypothetical protein